MKLTENQISTIKSWIESGDDLGKIQNQIRESFDINLTYLETRFLLSDLDIELKEEEPENDHPETIDENDTVAERSDEINQEQTDSENLKEESAQEPHSTNVSVSVDSITQPQCVISGKVTFSDGKIASWYFDQMGQLGLNPNEEGYTPSREDVAVFQVELRKVLAEQGLG